MKSRIVYSASALVIVLAIVLLISSLRVPKQQPQPSATNTTPNAAYQKHILGGFSINTPAEADKASAEGVQVVFKYSGIPDEQSVLGQKLQSLHMKIVDGFIWSYLTYYECHRTMTVKPPPAGDAAYCQQDSHPDLNDEQVLLTAIAEHLQEVSKNSLVIGYWVLDDWAPWDSGSARELLIKIHQLINYYTPGLPAICGFGGSISSGAKYSWDDRVSNNFSVQGCDRVGLYIYASISSDHATAPDAYNWSMSGLLEAAFASLEKRGWDSQKEPLLGIVQAFGGTISHSAYVRVTPTAQNIETQSRSFCAHGATGLVFYAWEDSGFGSTTRTPMNSSAIQQGIQMGIEACKSYWT